MYNYMYIRTADELHTCTQSKQYTSYVSSRKKEEKDNTDTYNTDQTSKTYMYNKTRYQRVGRLSTSGWHSHAHKALTC